MKKNCCTCEIDNSINHNFKSELKRSDYLKIQRHKSHFVQAVYVTIPDKNV